MKVLEGVKFVRSTRPSREMSCSIRRLVIRTINRSRPESVTAYSASASPLLLAVNQTSSPAGAQASPSSLDHSPDSTVFLPVRSTTATHPRVFNCVG